MLHFIWCLPGCLPVVAYRKCVPCVLFVDGLLYRHNYHNWIVDSRNSHLIYGSIYLGPTWSYQDIQPCLHYPLPSAILIENFIYSGQHWVEITFPSSSQFSIVYPFWCLTPILGELFAAEDVVPTSEFWGFIDFVKVQREGVFGINFVLSHIYKS